MSKELEKQIADILLQEIEGGFTNVPKWDKLQKASRAIVAHLSTPPASQTYPKWIRASERLPEGGNTIHRWKYRNNDVGIGWNCREALEIMLRDPDMWRDIEWLCEDPAPQVVEEKDWEARYCVANILLQEMKIYKELAELAAPYLQEMEADNAHDPSVGMYKDEKLTALVGRLDRQISADAGRWKSPPVEDKGIRDLWGFFNQYCEQCGAHENSITGMRVRDFVRFVLKESPYSPTDQWNVGKDPMATDKI